jgi:hypothetical protein
VLGLSCMSSASIPLQVMACTMPLLTTSSVKLRILFDHLSSSFTLHGMDMIFQPLSFPLTLLLFLHHLFSFLFHRFELCPFSTMLHSQIMCFHCKYFKFGPFYGPHLTSVTRTLPIIVVYVYISLAGDTWKVDFLEL